MPIRPTHQYISPRTKHSLGTHPRVLQQPRCMPQVGITDPRRTLIRRLHVRRKVCEHEQDILGRNIRVDRCRWVMLQDGRVVRLIHCWGDLGGRCWVLGEWAEGVVVWWPGVVDC